DKAVVRDKVLLVVTFEAPLMEKQT
ncbi:hypothetical protein D047_0402B, partial [Vibrio parahaemolyticus VPTS-2010_2]